MAKNENDKTVEYHRPVLCTQVLAMLEVAAGKRFIDATVGDAGHTLAIAREGGEVLGLDWDQDAIVRSQSRILKKQPEVRKRIKLVDGNFVQLEKLAHKYGFVNVDGILFDLGASTYQLSNKRRGFSCRRSGPLDMRMDQRQRLTARHLVNTASEEQLYAIFARHTQEHHSRAIARAIVRTRTIEGEIKTTHQLAEIVGQVVKKSSSHLHPATRIFHALRMAVNRELENLREALPQASNLLGVGGRLAVISFHSGEDRIVKHFFRQSKQIEPVTKRPIRPTKEEISTNYRARSARLRVGERI